MWRDLRFGENLTLSSFYSPGTVKEYQDDNAGEPCTYLIDDNSTHYTAY